MAIRRNVRLYEPDRSVTVTRLDSPRAREAAIEDIKVAMTDALIDLHRDQQRTGNQMTALGFDARGRRSGGAIAVSETLSRQLATSRENVAFETTGTRPYRTIDAWYANVQQLIDALTYADSAMKRMIRRKTGAGLGSIWFRMSPNKSKASQNATYTKNLGRAIDWIQSQENPQRIAVSIMGPTVPYRRNLIYNPKGRPMAIRRRGFGAVRALRRRINASNNVFLVDEGPQGGASSAGRRSLAKAVGMSIRDRVSNRFQGVGAFYGFVPTPNTGWLTYPGAGNRAVQWGRHIPVIVLTLVGAR